MVKIHQHAKFQANPSMHSLENAWKPLRTDGRTDGRTDRRTDGRTDMPLNGNGWSGGPTDPCTGQKRVFQASDGRTDGRTTRKHNASGA